MDDPMVTIAEFRSAMDAGLAKARLEAAGIRTFLANEHGSVYAPGSSDIVLQVAESDAHQAVALLRGEQPEEAPPEDANWREPEDVERCPVCEGSLVNVHEPSWPFQLLRLVLSMFLPLPERVFASNRRTCGICGYRWKDGDFAVTQVPPTPTRP